jgi:hypothetical protein
MQISDDALDEFITIYKEEFKDDISRSDAIEMASRLLTLYQLLSRKLPNDSVCGVEREEEVARSRQDGETRVSSPAL